MRELKLIQTFLSIPNFTINVGKKYYIKKHRVL